MLAANSSSQDFFDSTQSLKILCSQFLFQCQAEKKKAGPGDDCHGNPEIDRLRKEVQDTKEINKKLRELLQVHAHAFLYTHYQKSCVLSFIGFLCDE